MAEPASVGAVQPLPRGSLTVPLMTGEIGRREQGDVRCRFCQMGISAIAHKIGRAVYYMLARGTVFSMEKFLHA